MSGSGNLLKVWRITSLARKWSKGVSWTQKHFAKHKKWIWHWPLAWCVWHWVRVAVRVTMALARPLPGNHLPPWLSNHVRYSPTPRSAEQCMFTSLPWKHPCGLRNLIEEAACRSQAITKKTNQNGIFSLYSTLIGGLYSSSKPYRWRIVPVDRAWSHTMRVGPVLPTGWHTTMVQCFTDAYDAGCPIWQFQLGCLDRLRVIRVTTTKQDKLTIQNDVQCWRCTFSFFNSRSKNIYMLNVTKAMHSYISDKLEPQFIISRIIQWHKFYFWIFQYLFNNCIKNAEVSMVKGSWECRGTRSTSLEKLHPVIYVPVVTTQWTCAALKNVSA